MALLSAYMRDNCENALAEFLSERVFKDMEKRTVCPDEEGVKGFNEYMTRFKAGLESERKAGEV